MELKALSKSLLEIRDIGNKQFCCQYSLFKKKIPGEE
jgi:hypothetical protein